MTRHRAGDEDARTGDLADPDIVAYLDTLDHGALVGLLQAPLIVLDLHEPRATTWTPGSPRPALADEDPAVVAAIARCATARWRKSAVYGDAARTVSHPEPCGWCDYPAEELQRALEWAAHFGRYISGEWYVWVRGNRAYRRPTGRAGTFDNRRWAAFAALSPSEQRKAVDLAVRRSRGDPEAPRAHDPWCHLPPDHLDGCPEPES
ncbi:MAG: hypothetical protein MUE82_12655 [Chloroflexi bacterium]|nr:hypothetical protein [Chloroflexota bacterium]